MNPVLPDYFSRWQDWVSQMLYEFDTIPTFSDLFALTRERFERDVSVNTTLTLNDYHIRVDVSANPVTITLPLTSAVNRGYEWKVTLVSAPTHTMLVVPSGSDLIIGDTSVLYEVEWTSLVYRSRTGGWDIV